MNFDITDPFFWFISTVIASGLIEISPLEINPWGWFARKIGNALNADLFKKISKLENDMGTLEKKLDEHILDNQREKVDECRRRILTFNDKIIMNYDKITKERYDDVLKDIDDYEKYCLNHPEYPNNKANLAISNLKRDYQERY